MNNNPIKIAMLLARFHHAEILRHQRQTSDQKPAIIVIEDDDWPGYFIPVSGYEKCRIALEESGRNRVWRVECGYCDLVTGWMMYYEETADVAFLHLQQAHDAE